MIYIPLMIINLVWDIICYILNPIVILFADSEGNLPHILRWFQTHDSSLDLDLPFIQKNWPRLVELETDSTLVKKIKRYLRHLCWVYRNTGYAFAYEVCGATIVPSNLSYKKYGQYKVEDATEGIFIWEKGKSLWTTRWCLRFKAIYGPSVEDGYLRIYLGWKLTGAIDNYPNGSDVPERAMLAFHVNPFRNFAGFLKYLGRKIKALF